MPTPIPLPTQTPTLLATSTPTLVFKVDIPEDYALFQGDSVKTWLPESYVGGSKEDLKYIVEKMEQLGPEFEQIAQSIKTNPDAFIIFAFDTNIGSSRFSTNMNVTEEFVPTNMSMDLILDNVVHTYESYGWNVTFLSKWMALGKTSKPLINWHPHLSGDYETAHIIVEVNTQGVKSKLIQFIVKCGNSLWAITFGTGPSEFDERLPDFEASISSLEIGDSTCNK